MDSTLSSNGEMVTSGYYRETQQVFTTSTPNGTHGQHVTIQYTTQQSTESGIDNPFRPEGELSMEADEIVKAIKEGRPFDSIDSGRASRVQQQQAVENGKAPTQSNGNTKNGKTKSPPGGKKDQKPGVVDVQRGIVVPPTDAPPVELVVVKKKPKCKCCVIQ